MESRAIHGDSLHKLKELSSNSVDMIATDPPYGYSFMGKEWDKVLPDKRIWKECLRVLKHGSFAFIMSAPRQDVLSRMILDLEDAGFDTGFTSMYWAYASGFPKASNTSKLIDKKLGVKPDVVGTKTHAKNLEEALEKKTGFLADEANKNNKKMMGYGDEPITKATSDKAKKMDGSYLGFQPKPALEVIIVVMKPLKEKNYIEQAMKDGKGVTWLDNCRVPYTSNNDVESARYGSVTPSNVYGWANTEKKNIDDKNILASEKGRFPANLIVSDDAVNIKGAPKPVKAHYSERVTKITSDNTPDYTPDDRGRFPANLIVSDDAIDTGEITKSSGGVVKAGNTNVVYGKFDKDVYTATPKDEGSFSRYFDVDKWWAQFIITPKPSKAEKNAGLDHLEKKDIQPAGLAGAIEKGTERRRLPRQNSHPTVKPLKLMSYLITLGSREGDIVLEPFMGSGTTCLASKNLNRKYIGIEREEEYYKIACGRLGIEPETHTYEKADEMADALTEQTLIEIEKELGDPEKRAEEVIENLKDKQIMVFKCDVCGFVAKDQKAYDDHIPRAFHQDSL